MSKQVGLHVHSEFSFLDGFSKVTDIARRAKELGQQAVALTDHGECAGHVKFQRACREQDIKPIFGMEGYWIDDISAARATGRYPSNLSHICLLARDQKGLSNLWAWSSVAYDAEHHYHRPLADPALMRQYAEGLYASDGCFAGSERYLTEEGTKTFVETVGTRQRVLGVRGWTDAEIKSFGVQQLYELVVRRGRATKTILTTGNHRWFVQADGHAAVHREALTAELHPGDRLRSRWADADTGHPSGGWKVVSVTPTGRSEEVYCAVVPDGHAFTLEDNILTGNCMLTQLNAAVQAGDEDRARQYMAQLLDIFGDRFYVELHTWQFMYPSSDDRVMFSGKAISTIEANRLMTNLNQAKLRLAKELGVPWVIVNDCHHSWPEDWLKKDLANQISRDKGDQVANGQKADHHMGEDELYYWMARHGISREDVARGIEHAWRIAEDCNAEIRPMLDMPSFSGSPDEDMRVFLDAVEEGFRRKVVDAGRDAETYFRRLESEVELICQRRFCGYFLTVADYVRAAKTGTWKTYVQAGADPEPIMTGPGRGSAGGSLVAWLLGITSIDPIRYNLLFERFLNPDRKGFPDIDVDFPQQHLKGMNAYLRARYGADHVCGIGTITRNGAKAMLRDLGRAMDIPMPEINEMSKIIETAMAIVASDDSGDEDTGAELGWDEILAEKGGELAPWARKYPELFEQLGEMVGIARQSGKHPAGVLISDKPLLGLIPLRTRNHRTAEETVTTQWDMAEIEELGGVKFDLLGIRHLDTIDVARKLVHERHGVELDFEALDPDRPEPEIWEPIDRGRTTGLFQVETPGATRTAMELRPRNVRDIAALISIIRPGVKDAGETERYLRRRAGQEEVVYDHPLMEPIVGETYGILVYQEQMIRAARDLAGFTPGEADDLRRVTAKKKADQIEPFRVKFRQGCLDNPAFMAPLGGDLRAAEKVIDKIWASINASARYSFNLSHAVGYAHVSWWEAWLAHHYPAEFLVALMSTDDGSIVRYIREARRRGLPMLPPDVNESEAHFTITAEGIRYGLESLRGVGDSAAAEIRRKRPYSDHMDFLRRTKVGKTQIMALIKIGAFDSLAYDPELDGDWRPSSRSRVLRDYYRHLVLTKHTSAGKVARMSEAERDDHVAAWFDRRRTRRGFAKDFPEFDFGDPDVIYAIETELIGTFVLVDPMAPYLRALDEVAIRDPAEVQEHKVGDLFVIGGQVTKIKRHTIQRGRSAGQEMAFVGVTYNEQDFDLTVFPETWASVRNLLVVGAPVACQVIRDNRNCHLVSVERLDLLWKEAS